ncbi:MAG: hypothetical protein ACYC9M_08950 [Desulfobulbaceae bacterium]
MIYKAAREKGNRMQQRQVLSKTVILLGGLLVPLSANPAPAYALQTHGALEGLFAHQGAHLFLTVSLLIFLVNIQRSRLKADKAWRLLFWGTFLLALWNIWAFFGHVAEIFTPEAVFVRLPGQQIPSLLVKSWREVAFYVFKMDHLLCLPALLLYYRGLTKIQATFHENGIHRKREPS